MSEPAYRLCLRLASGRGIAALAALAAGLMTLFRLRSDALGLSGSALDSRLTYTPADVVAFMQALGPEGRGLYAATELSLDVAFPLTYGCLLAALLARRYRNASDGGREWLRLPAAVVAADLTENLLLAYLAVSYDGGPSPAAWAASAATAAKWGLVGLTAAVLLLRPGHRARS